jgi:hypothetical protein
MPQRALLEKNLARAEEAVREGRVRCAEQRRQVQELQLTGRSTELAESVLALCEQSLALHELDVERLRKELENHRPLPPHLVN